MSSWSAMSGGMAPNPPPNPPKAFAAAAVAGAGACVCARLPLGFCRGSKARPFPLLGTRPCLSVCAGAKELLQQTCSFLATTSLLQKEQYECDGRVTCWVDGRKFRVHDQVRSRSRRLHTASSIVSRITWLPLKQQISTFRPSSKASNSCLSADFSGSSCGMSVCSGGELLGRDRVPAS